MYYCGDLFDFRVAPQLLSTDYDRRKLMITFIAGVVYNT